MSEYSYSSTRKLLTQSSALTAMVPASDIRIGFLKQPDNFPSIALSQIGGSTYGYTGYAKSDAGYKQRRDDRTFQVNIYSRSGMLHLQKVSDQVVLALMSGSGYRKISDNDGYEDGIKSYRKIQTWTSWSMIDD